MIAGQSEMKKDLDVDTFRREVMDEKLPRQHFIISREDGMEELKKDKPLQRQQLQTFCKSMCHV